MKIIEYFRDIRERLIHIESKLDRQIHINEDKNTFAYLITKKWKLMIFGDYTKERFKNSNWFSEFMQRLAHYDCEIVVAINIDKSSLFPLINENQFRIAYKNTDFTIVVPGFEKKAKKMLTSHVDGRKMWIYRGLKNNNDYFENISYSGWISSLALFNSKSQAIRNISYIGKYTSCDCDEVTFLVNSKYKLMVQELSNGTVYQQNDIEAFDYLTKKYYGYCDGMKGWFLDIGANIGTSSIWFKKKLQSDVKILGFEPLYENCKQFICNCVLNDISSEEYIIENVACSNDEKNVELMISDDNLGDNRVVVEGNIDNTRRIERTNTVRLDSYLKEKNIDINDIKYVWMDVQAHEKFVIEGGIDLFSKYRVPLYMEFWPEQLMLNKSLDDLISVLSKCYRGFINIEWFKAGDEKTYPIEQMKKIAEEFPKYSFDLFFIK